MTSTMIEVLPDATIATKPATRWPVTNLADIQRALRVFRCQPTSFQETFKYGASVDYPIIMRVQPCPAFPATHTVLIQVEDLASDTKRQGDFVRRTFDTAETCEQLHKLAAFTLSSAVTFESGAHVQQPISSSREQDSPATAQQPISSSREQDSPGLRLPATAQQPRLDPQPSGWIHLN